MKNIIKATALALTACMLASSCDILEDAHNSYDNALNQSNMWQDENDVTSSTYGIYYRLRNEFVQDKINVFFWGELRVGDYMWGPSLLSLVNDNDMIQVRHSTMTGSTASVGWSGLYTTIDQANLVLKYAPKVEMTEAAKGYAIGQAAFARAYCYFWAARMWGNVPLITNPIESTTQEETYPTRTDKAKVYAQIAEDIQTALDNEEYLGTNKYFATADAVNMLKAEYNLWMYTTQNGGDACLTAAETALSAIGISNTRLQSDYAGIFDRTKKCGTEVIFALNNNQADGNTGGFYNYFTHGANLIAASYRGNPVPVKSTQWFSYSEEFQNRLLDSKKTNGDKRVDCNLGYGPYGADGGNVSWPNKYKGELSASGVINDSDIMYYRYGQAVMMYAELKYYQGNYAAANNALNLIAQRAYGKSNFYSKATKEAVLEALTNEYFLEFPCEGVIWWALIRLGQIWDYAPDSTLGVTFKQMQTENPNILLWPIANSSITKNSKLTQTEGWS